MNSLRPFRTRPIDDRDFWNRIATADRFADLRNSIFDIASRAPAVPLAGSASTYLATRRANDRGSGDRYVRESRRDLGSLTVRRCILGIDPADRDDVLLDTLFARATEATWTSSAHLSTDLPPAGRPQLDLSDCEMAASLAETLELLRPWIEGQSSTLLDSIVWQIDRRVIEPFGRGHYVTWADNDPTRQINNWAGVCGGTILAACEALAALGQPRPDARERAIQTLRLFVERSFTESGECDEGIGYWVYGMLGACCGLSRLTEEELTDRIGLDRLRQIADYPRRAHLFDSTFYSGNDSRMTANAHPGIAYWLADATGVDWLRTWAERRSEFNEQAISRTAFLLRYIDGLERAEELANSSRTRSNPTATSKETSKISNERVDPPNRYLPDQQVAIFACGNMTVCVGGGHNGERHNHNDIGHFLIAVDGQWVVPDLGGPSPYPADFFGSRRYEYLVASSLGHNCPIIGGYAQRPGEEAHAVVELIDVEAGRFVIDVTSAYPPEAHLTGWRREVRAGSNRFDISDHFTARPRTSVSLRIWSLVRPDTVGQDIAVSGQFGLGRLRCELASRPLTARVLEIDPQEHNLLRLNVETIYCVELDYVADGNGELRVDSWFLVDKR